VKVDLHERLEAVGPAAWDQLVAGSRLRSPFLTWTWQREWVRAFAPGRRLEIRRVQDDDGRLIALLPLCEMEPGRWILLGGADVSDYLDLIALHEREEAAWGALLEARIPSRAVWELHAVPATSPTVSRLPELAAGHPLRVTATLEERCPVLALPPTWEAYLGTLSGKHRHELTRKLRRFEREVPDARITALARRDEIETRLGDFLDLHRRSRAGKSRFMDARMEGFFRRVLAVLADRGTVRVWFLDLPSGPAATFICLEWDGTVGLYNSGFHPDHASLSPGLILLAHIVRDAIHRRRPRFDFLRGEERYKYEFGPSPEEVYAVTVEPAGAAAP
jgi:CelD/BcsL family acetyltransferase involved in cellulose biosynthesis